VKEAKRLDEENGNTHWQDAMSLELAQLQECNTFWNLGRNAKAPEGYQKITVHFVFDVKHDGRHKARLVAGGHLTQPPLESVHSGVVSLRSIRIVVFLAELNGLEVFNADVGNAYLEAKTKEKVYIIGGEGFGDLEGCTLIIYKALCGLRTSGKRHHERFADTLREMGFTPSKADPDVWMRANGNVHECIAVYVDDLILAALDAQALANTLMEDYKYKLKGVGPIKFHLGCDYERDPDGTLAHGPKTHVEKMLSSCESMFGDKPKQCSSPLEKNDHPELDDSAELGEADIAKCQSMIGSLSWAVTLGRFDVITAVMTMSGFRLAPRIGHLNCLKRMHGYLAKFKDAKIRVRTGSPDCSDVPDEIYEWAYSVYGDVKEVIPDDMPVPLGKSVTTTSYKDANLYHDLLTGRSVTGILHFLNGTPIDWFSKKQSTVETATYGSEFVAARLATDQILDLRISLRYLGVPVEEQSFLFGDSQSVITSATVPQSPLSKRHLALAYQRVHEAVAARILHFLPVNGKCNPADVLSKHCGHVQACPLLKPLLFW